MRLSKVFFLAMACTALLAWTGAAFAAVADFEDLILAQESYWNGSDGSGGFVSGDSYFNNNYTAAYGSWDAWAYSNVTDNATPEMVNQYSAITGGGVNGSANYGVSYVSSWAATPAMISFGADTGEDYGTTISGFYITNTTYAYYSMLQGDPHAKRFGGESGDDGDWFKLIITGITESGYTSNTVEFYLADFRFADNSYDYIVDSWTWVDLTGLGDVIGLEFSMGSSDVGDWGINTPVYFAMDNLNGAPVPVPAGVWLLGSGLVGVLSVRRKLGK